MPVILLEEDEEEWLNRDVIEPERLSQLLKQYQERDAILSQAIAPNTGQHERGTITRLHRFRDTAPYCCSIRNSPVISSRKLL
jgi:putative SOS response-associated peptidase YedK